MAEALDPGTPDPEEPTAGPVPAGYRAVPVSDVGHPLADRVGEDADGVGWVATESRSRVIHLSPLRTNLLASALRDGRRPVLITDENSALTPAFAQAWRNAGGTWVVRESAGGMRNGLDGRRLTEIEQAWRLPAPSSVDEVAVNYLRPVPAEVVQVSVIAALRHPARDTTVLGAPVAALSETMFGRPPRVWGPHEPVGSVWDRNALTEMVRGGMPEETAVFVSGPDLFATVSAQRTRRGVEEMVNAVLGLGTPTEQDFAGLRERLSAVLRWLAETSMPLVVLVLARPGRRDLLLPPFLNAPPVPLALLVGAPAVRGFGLDPQAMRERFGAQVVGRPRIPALLFEFPDQAADAWHQLDAVLADFDPDQLADALGPAGSALRSVRRERPRAEDGGSDGQP